MEIQNNSTKASEEREYHTRKMDDLGKIAIPEDIQATLGIKKSELPSFEVKVHQEEQEPYIGLHLLKN